MKFGYSAEEISFREEFRAWLKENLPLGWMDGKRDLPKAERDLEHFLRDWQRKLYKGGWAGIAWPKEYGGRGASLVQQMIYEEELAMHEAPPQANWIGFAMVGPTIMQFGTPEQKRRFIDPMLQGEEIWCQGYSEPNAGSDLAAVHTRAEDAGNHFIVSGQKIWTSFAQMSDWCLLLCRTDPTAPKHKGLSILLVDMHSPGIEVRPIRQITDDAEFNEVFFTDVAVPKANLLGPLNDGWKVAVALLMFERRNGSFTHQFQQYFQMLVELARSQTRDGVPLIKDPVIRDRLAQFYTEIEIARLNFLRGISTELRRGAPGFESSLEKMWGPEINKRMQAFALELLGEDSLYDTHVVTAPMKAAFQFNYLYSFCLTIAGGTAEIQRNIVAERLLGLPRG